MKPTDCVRHPGVPVAEPNDYWCAECVRRQEQAGAAWADKHWADNPQPALEQFAGTFGRTENAHDNPNAVYRRMQAQHTIDRSKE